MGIGVDLFYAANFSPTARYLRDPYLAFSARVEAKPVFDDPALAFYANADESGVWCYRGDRSGVDGKMLVASAHAVPGVVNLATGHGRPYIAKSGVWSRPWHNIAAQIDMSLGGNSGTGAGGYGTISLPAVSDVAGRFTDPTPVHAGCTYKAWALVSGTAGQTTTARISDESNIEGTEEQITFTGSPQVVPLEHTFAAARSNGARFRFFRDGSDTATSFAVLGLIFQRWDFPVDNPGGWSVENLPPDPGFAPHFHIGVEYDEATGKAAGFVLDDSYVQGVVDPTFTGLVPGVVGSGGVVAARGGSVQSWGGTTTISEGSRNGRKTLKVRLAGTPTTNPVVVFNSAHLGLTVAEGDSVNSSVECRLADGSLTNIDGLRQRATFVTSAPVYVDKTLADATTVTADWGVFEVPATVPATAERAGCAVEVSYSGGAIDVTLEFDMPQITKSAIRLPFLPSIPDGQTTHAAQVPYFDWSKIAPLGPDLYSAQEQIGAIDWGVTGSGGADFTNGDFGTGDLTGWSNTSDAGGAVTYNAGGYVEITNTSGTARLAQTVVGTAGKARVVTFEVISNDSTVGGFYLGNTNVFGFAGRAPGTYSFILVSGGTDNFSLRNFDAGTTIAVDNLNIADFNLPWMSSTGEGRFSVSGNTITLSAGSAAETVSLLAAPLGLSDGDVVEVDVSLVRTSASGSIHLRNAAGTNLLSVNTANGNNRSGKRQCVVANGVVCQFLADAAASAGSITINGVKAAYQGPITAFVDYVPNDTATLERLIDFQKAGSTNTNEGMLIEQRSSDARLAANMQNITPTFLAGVTSDEVAVSGTRSRVAVNFGPDDVRLTLDGDAANTPDTGTGGIVPKIGGVYLGCNTGVGSFTTGQIKAFGIFCRAADNTDLAALAPAE